MAWGSLVGMITRNHGTEATAVAKAATMTEGPRRANYDDT